MIFHQPFNSLGSYHYNAVFYTDQIWQPHFHKNMELIYVLEGAVNCTVNGITYRLTAEDMGLCLPYDIHSYTPEPDSRYWVLVFSEDFVRYFSRLIAGKNGDGFSFACADSVKAFIRQQLVYCQKPEVMTLKSGLYALCQAYLNSVPLKDGEMGQKQAVVEIADYIRQNHTGTVSLKAIAQRLGYDYHYMSRYFHRVFGMRFTDFVNIYRLETALQMLEESNSKITQIALDSGFQTTRNFNSYFLQQMGITPSQYRKNLKNSRLP